MYTTAAPYFPRDEFDARLAVVRRGIAERGLNLLLLPSPENFFYLTGLDHWGYFAPHILLVPIEGEMVLIARGMEKVTISHQVVNARFAGHGDHETAAEAFARVLADSRYSAERIGIEAWSSGLPHGLALALLRQASSSQWLDATGLVDELRYVKSAEEQECMRQAARVSDAGAAAAIAAIRAGATERQVAAECEHAMIAAGGTLSGLRAVHPLDRPPW
jgi:Xaa-Pro dipeptidase